VDKNPFGCLYESFSTIILDKILQRDFIMTRRSLNQNFDGVRQMLVKYELLAVATPSLPG
jgi:hypothetical protein